MNTFMDEQTFHLPRTERSSAPTGYSVQLSTEMMSPGAAHPDTETIRRRTQLAMEAIVRFVEG